jgi:phosphoribosylanthranilate isomerase
MGYMAVMDRPRPIVKICGLKTAVDLDAALEAGADMVGFVFFPPSPRHLDLETARGLGRRVEGRARKVALTVDADDQTLAQVVEALRPDMLQLHGLETPDRTAQARARFGLPVIKAIGVGDRADLAQIAAYDGAADVILLDAKPAPDASRPGGNGSPFDWRLLSDFRRESLWLLSGGLTCEHVAEAIAFSGAPGVDVSSGVERAPGVKAPELIARFVAAARGPRSPF